MDKNTLLEWLDKATALELNEVVKAIEEKIGVSSLAMTAGSASVPGEGVAKEEKDAFTIMLAASGEQKIAVMKVVKEALGLGLKEAKDLVDAAPATLKEGVKKAEAEEIKKKIEEAGGKIELK